MSRPPLLLSGRPQDRPVNPTLLDTWLRAHGLAKAQFSRMVGVDQKTVKYWCNGQVTPDLVSAFLIDKVTAGGVPVSSWLGAEIAKVAWNYRLRLGERMRHEGADDGES